jgi:hypothetical protein
MMRHLRLLALVPLALALALVATGCGGNQGGSGNVALPVLEDLEPVANATARADSARFEMEFEMDVPAFGPFAFTASGAFDTPSKQAEMTMDLGSFAELMSGLAGSFGGNAPSGLGDPEKWKLEMRLDGLVAYMRMPLLASELPNGKEWVRLDLAAAARLKGMDLAELQSLAKGSDPRETLDFLRSVAGDVTRVGTEDVRGVPTTHYFAIIDWQKALRQAARQAGQEGILQQLQSLGGSMSNVPVDVWVDADSRVRRMTMEFSFSSPDGQEQATASMSMELFDYGAPVSVEAPPASDVVDALKLR